MVAPGLQILIVKNSISSLHLHTHKANVLVRTYLSHEVVC